MMERDSITLLTIGNIESKMSDELIKRRAELLSFSRAIVNEVEYIDYIISLREKKLFNKDSK